MKNVKSKLSQTLNEYYTTRYRLILTGTPLQVSSPNRTPKLKLNLRTICQNFGHCSISSYLKFSIPSNRSTIGSMPHSPIPVVKRWRWMKKKLSSSSSVFIKFYDLSFFVDWRRMLNRNYLIKSRKSFTQRCRHCSGSCTRVYRSTRRFLLIWLLGKLPMPNTRT